jgi:hypothetical protein
LALVCLYIDHLPGNFFSRFTLHAYGFNDAAEVFVLVAGISAGLAYCATFERKGWRAGSRRVLRRVLQVYGTHIMLVAVCAAALWIGARATGSPDMLRTYKYAFFGSAALEEIRHALSLSLQPHHLNILPLYVVLLAAVPIVLLLQRIHIAALAAVSLALWLLPRAFDVNLPSDLHSRGWYFNPFAWQLLFVVGVLWGQGWRRGYSLPRSAILASLAVAYCGFALVAVAPWAKLPALAEWRILPHDWMGSVDKERLSLLRVLDVLALAYLTVFFVPASARWLESAWAKFFRALGRASLSVFAMSAILDVIGWIVWHSGGRGIACQFALIVCGIAIMRLAARVAEDGALRATGSATNVRRKSWYVRARLAMSSDGVPPLRH